MIISPASGDSHNVLGTTATIKLSSSETNGHLAVILHAVPLNTGPPPHRHEHEDELLYVLDGAFEFILRDPSTWHRATQGTIVRVPAGTLHTSRATTDASQLLSIYTAAGGEEFFREIDTIDQTDLAAVLALASRHGMTFPAPTPERTPCPSA